MPRGLGRMPSAAAPSPPRGLSRMPVASAQAKIARDPSKAVVAPPRLKPISTREYGKGGTPLSGAPSQGVMGAGIGYGGPTRGV